MNIEFLGKLHPLLVHFPIGIIPLIALFQLLMWKKKVWITKEGVLLKEMAPGWEPEEIQELTEPKLIISPDIKDVELV